MAMLNKQMVYDIYDDMNNEYMYIYLYIYDIYDISYIYIWDMANMADMG